MNKYAVRMSVCLCIHVHELLLTQQLTAGTKRMALNVTSPSAVKWVLARGSAESFENRR